MKNIPFFGLLLFVQLSATCLLADETKDKTIEDFFNFYTNQSRVNKDEININDHYDANKVNKLCYQDELQVFSAERGVLRQWKKAWLSKNMSDFDALGGDGFNSKTEFFPTPLAKATREFDGITVRGWNKNNLKTIRDYLGRYSEIVDMDIGIVDYTADYAKRGADSRFSSFEGVVKIELRGFDTHHARIMDRGQWKVLFTQVEKGQWKISKSAPIEGETLFSNRTPSYVEKTKEMGLASLPVYLRTEAIRRGGYALSVADINGDGVNDLLVGFRDGVDLLIGKKDGSYVSGLKGSGLEKLKYIKTAVFADFQNRGIQDLVVTTLDPESKLAYEGASSVLFFKGDGAGHFNQVPVDFGKKRGFLQPMPTAVADFNNDGYLDLYVGYPGVRDFTEFGNRGEIQNPQGFYLNDHKGSFHDFTDQFQEESYKNKSRFYPHASMALDFDQKNGVDLLVVDDRNNLSPVYVNDGKGKFTQSAEEIGLGNYGYGMSIAAGDINNDGITDLLMTNVNFDAGIRASKACKRMWEAWMPHSEPGLRLFQGLGDGKFQEVTGKSGVLSALGQGAAGLTFLDYNNDGKMDIYLVNGLWSGSPEGEETSTLFTTMASDLTKLPMNHAVNSEDSIGFKAFLRKTINGITSSDSTGKSYKGHPSLAGFQRNRLFHNNGDGTFTEVAFFEGLDSIYDGFIVGTIVNEMGKQDLVLRNGDPASTDYSFPVVQYFRNENTSKNGSIDLTFEGTKSNRDAFGAYAIAKFKDHKQVQHLVANSGSLQNERVMHFGLGKYQEIPEIEVHWPSGQVQDLQHLKRGRYHIREMAGLAKAQ